MLDRFLPRVLALFGLCGLLVAQHGLLAPPGFVVELVAQTPVLRWPSAVLPCRDGSVLVGEDPMDMPGPAHEPIDRIVRFRRTSAGTWEKTLFADRLYAVFGLLEIGDSVYCMNMPHLTVLRDQDGDGYAESREVLIENLGVPPPGADGGFNDHIVSGLQRGLDGWIYVAVGDKGVPRATGRDGSTITLRGGGIVRLRPDGTRLEVVARGLRNILEPCLDAEDELFTYDNTDDGRGWWTRFTHVVPGGEYGYPWDYQKHPERHLPCLGDCGGGSPTGGAAYRESAWPAEFHGDLFFCDWADRVVRRFEVERRGATFALTGHSDFLRAEEGAAPFHPTDLAFSLDGRALLVADWNFGGWQKPDERGRLFLVRRENEVASEPLAPLATLEAQFGALASDQYSLRREAQDRLIAAGRVALPGLRSILETSRHEAARRHALWAWAEIQRSLGLSEPWPILPEASPALIAQSIRAQETTSPAKWPEEPWLLRTELSQALGTATALRSLPPRPDRLPDGVLRFLARRVWARSASARDLLGAFEDPNSQSEAGLILRHLDRPLVVSELADALRDRLGRDTAPVRFLVALIDALGPLHQRPPAWDGRWWGIGPADDAPPRHTEAWSATPAVTLALRAAIRHPNSEVAASARRAVQQTAAPELLQDLLGFAGELADGSPDLLPMMSVFAGVRFSGARALFRAQLSSPSASHRLAAIAGLRALEDRESAASVLAKLTDADLEVRRAVLRTVTAWRLAEARSALLGFIEDPELRTTAWDGLAALGTADDAALLLASLSDQNGLVRQKSRQAVERLATELRPYLEAEADRISPAVLYEIQKIYSRPEALRHWDVLGPIPKVQAPPTARESAATWRSCETTAERGRVDLKALLSGGNDQIAFASTKIVESRSRATRLRVGSDDDVAIWLNGELVHDHAVTRGWRASEDSVPVTLRSGANHLLVRIGQGYGDWAFNVEWPASTGGPLFLREGVPPPRERLRDAALGGTGSVESGRTLFRDRARLMCASCHRAEGFGTALGPDLSEIGKKSSRREIIDSVLEPSLKILDGYRESGVELRDGQALYGLLSEPAPGEFQLVDSEGETHRFLATELQSRWTLQSSAMPEGLVDSLDPKAFADLVAYLESLRSATP